MNSLILSKVEQNKGSYSLLAVDSEVYGLTEHGTHITIESLTTKQPVEIPCTNAISFDFLIAQNALSIATGSGEIFLYHLDSSSYEAIGCVDKGIEALQFSPDSELLVIVTGLNSVILMTSDFHIVTEFELSESAHESQVNVGWGKKETQFHGKQGKDTKSEIQIENGLSNDDKKPRITWRGDGDYFVVSFLNPFRVLQIYNREGILQSISENCSFLEQSLSWNSGLITSTQMLPHKHDVVFFEKNGLRHGEFTLKEKNSKVYDLQWNADSTTLAINLSFQLNGKEVNVIQIWNSANYYYYLKQEIQGCRQMKWDNELPLVLHTILLDGSYSRFEFITKTFVSSSLEETNQGTVAVIDGNCVNLTPFKTKNIPPPLCFSKMDFTFQVLDVSFGFEGEDMAVLGCDSIEFISGIAGKKNDIVRLGTLKLIVENFLPRQLEWINGKQVLVLGYNQELLKDELLLVEFEQFEFKNVKRVDLDSIKSIITLYQNIDLKTIAIQTSEGEIYQVVQIGDDYTVEFRTCFSTACVSISSIKFEEMICWIGLNERNKLFLDDQVLAIDCTSFVVHNEFLIISTLEHLLKFISKKLSYNDFKFLEKENSAQFNEKFRAIELGARIITCVPSHINLVLQMPRGNLETICPRALVLSSVRQSIDKKQYKEAFVISRKHRIDLNLLIDHAPEQFKENASEIIMQIEKPDYLNLLVAGLKNEDVTRTMYQPLNVVQDELSYEEMKNSGKINAVCDLLRTALDENSKIPTEHDYTQTILTTFAKQEPPQLENALKRILEIKNQSTKESESALKYLIFLCDVDMLYDVALGIYDFPLVLMVAQYSQKDPREYLPFLSELQKLDTNYQRFSIDSHLKKYTQALVHLSKCDDRFEELVQFMKSNSIYKDAMKLFDTTSDKHTRILVEFAKFQQQKRDFEEAGILYQMASHYTQAIDCYIQGLLWKEAAVIITKTKADKLKHATSMIDGLLSINKYDQVARLYLDFLENPSMAVEMFAKGQLWNDAIMTAEKYNLTEMIDKAIKPELLAYGHSFVEEMQELKQKLETKALRLRKFRSDKLKKDEMVQEVDMLDDTASMATTRITQRTGYTGMTGFTGLTGLSSQTGKTGKQRRKMARKRAAGKDKAFEDEYLMKSWKDSVLKINALMPDVKLLLAALMGNGYLLVANNVQKAFKQVVGMIEWHLSEVFKVQPVFDPRSLGLEGDDDLKPFVIEPPQLALTKWWTECLDLK